MDWNTVEQRLHSRGPRPKSQLTPAAVLVLIAGESVVLEVRSARLRTQPGEVCLPGGRMEPGESPEQCALRETAEELGVSGGDIEVLGRLDCLFHGVGQLIYPVLARTGPETLERLRLNPGEVEQVFTVPVDWLLQHPPRPYQYRMQAQPDPSLPEQMLRWVMSYPNLRRGSYWDYQGHLIWGLTERILEMLCDLAREEG